MFFRKDSSACYPMEHGAQVKDPCCDVFKRSPNNFLKNLDYILKRYQLPKCFWLVKDWVMFLLELVTVANQYP
ncbi:hypothetical protein DICVIV_14136 [Dictyocaulus viviparus]|uniref:Uncharacterized protein n=1 Tax=Dictyocaulus viviparus TaxID=29172 RepID=A0A0D8X8I6_DICVI|nr:hypothetical protein DICVIV_14136 [Dictyocaulus viviparus]